MSGGQGVAGNALVCAEKVFRVLVEGPEPLGLYCGGDRWGWLPARPVDLAELGSLLLKGGCADEVKDAVWREMVTRARTGRPEWVIGCVGLALPGLRNVVARASHKCAPGLAEDIVSEAVAEFVAQLQQIDLGRPHVVARLLLWARKGALRARGRETRHVMRREALDVLDEVAASGEGAIGQEPVPRRFGSGRSRRGRRS